MREQIADVKVVPGFSLRKPLKRKVRDSFYSHVLYGNLERKLPQS